MSESLTDAPSEHRRRSDGTPGIRVVHVLHYFGRGGMEKGVLTCIREGSPDFEHVVVCLATTRDMEHLLPPGVRLISLNKASGNSFRFVFKVARVLRELMPCVVHTRNWAGMDAILAARIAGIRSVAHGEHGWQITDVRGADWQRRLVRRGLSRWVRNVTCVSRDLQEWLRKDVRVRCPVIQIYNGIDSVTFAPGPGGQELRQELGIDPDVPLVGHVGRLDAVKDQATLFRAFARLRQIHPNAVLLCAGDGPERERLERLVGPGIRLLGTRDDVPRLLRALDIFVLTSLNEGISNTILEAMACAVPVIATRVGGNPEILTHGETGFLFEAGDDGALAGHMDAYLRDPELRRRHGAAGRASVQGRFSVERMVRNYETVWRACAEHARP